MTAEYMRWIIIIRGRIGDVSADQHSTEEGVASGQGLAALPTQESEAAEGEANIVLVLSGQHQQHARAELERLLADTDHYDHDDASVSTHTLLFV